MFKSIRSISIGLIVTARMSIGVFGFAPSSSDPTGGSSSFRISRHRREGSSLDAHFITFDLDDTLFPVAPTIADANEALFLHLKSLGCDATQEEYIGTSKKIRIDLANDNEVITYTELRKRTIRALLENNNRRPRNDNDDDDDDDDAVVVAVSDSVVDGSYDVWEEHRHIGAEKHLYPGAVSMLNRLKSNHPDAVIAAITNGKGNPLMMESIRGFFDFCVSGEDDDVFPLRKPDEGIYKVALERFRALSEERRSAPVVVDDDDDEDDRRCCWIHVGDDLANDVGASARCGAKAIWLDLDEEEYDQTASTRDPSKPQPSWSTATKEELEKRKLLDEEARRYVSRRTTTLDALPSDIEAIILEESFSA